MNIKQITIISILIPTLLLACSSVEGPPATPEAPRPVPLGFAAAEAATGADVVNLPGAVVLPDDARYALAPPSEVRLTRWLVAPGDAVEVGTPLAESVSLELGGLESEAREQREVLGSRQRLLEVVRGQVAAGVRPMDAQREAEVAVAEARGRLGVLERQRAARASGTSGGSWRSPVAGVVSQLRCAPESVQGPGAPCAEVLELSRAVVEVHVPERHASRIAAQGEASMYPSSGEAEVRLRVVRLAPTLEASSRTRAVYLAPLSGEALRVGATGRVRLEATPSPGVVRVPEGAVTELEGVSVLFTRRDAGAAAVPVQIEGRHDGALLVRGAGLEVGTPVVVRGVLQAKSAALLERSDAP